MTGGAAAPPCAGGAPLISHGLLGAAASSHRPRRYHLKRELARVYTTFVFSCVRRPVEFITPLPVSGHISARSSPRRRQPRRRQKSRSLNSRAPRERAAGHERAEAGARPGL